ncbi:hypothetical protein JOE56_000024 [Brevibacterium paucivorans]|uniref:Uncharacterized protein n=1 Tax=Brevibacterium paucivorans TaxID=170994 RepID=A0ABS2SGF4_9MICO|nr:hypothetical protein [Brevibacterium paucivorans]
MTWVPVATATFMSSVEQVSVASASAANTAVRQISTALGIAVFGAVSTRAFQARVQDSGLFEAWSLPQGADALVTTVIGSLRALVPAAEAGVRTALDYSTNRS